MRLSLLIILLLWFAPAPRAQEAAPDEIVCVGEGMAALGDDPASAEEEAVWDAKRNAVEQAAGFFLKARAVGRDFQLETDRIEGRTDGFVQKWEIVPGSRRVETVGNAKMLRLKVRAVVALLPVIRKLEDIRDVYDDLERPRIRVTVAGDSENGAAKHALLTALQAQGFEIATGDAAEITLSARVDSAPDAETRRQRLRLRRRGIGGRLPRRDDAANRFRSQRAGAFRRESGSDGQQFSGRRRSPN